MQTVKIAIHNKDRRIGAMVKALAFEIAGPSAVTGTSKEFLEGHGYLVFRLPSVEKVDEFKDAVAMYLPALLATIVEVRSD